MYVHIAFFKSEIILHKYGEISNLFVKSLPELDQKFKWWKLPSNAVDPTIQNCFTKLSKQFYIMILILSKARIEFVSL